MKARSSWLRTAAMLTSLAAAMAGCGDDEKTYAPFDCPARGLFGVQSDGRCACEKTYIWCPSQGAQVVVEPGSGECICAEVGAACPSAIDGYLVCAPVRAALVCRQGKFEHMFDCPGLEDCGRNNPGADAYYPDRVWCLSAGNGLATAADGLPCQSSDSVACSPDRASILECSAGAWGVSRPCVEGRVCGTVSCDSGTCIGCEYP